MTELIHAPWTPEQVDALNAFQRRGGMHPFTCGADHAGPSPTLVARPDGWHCPGSYRAPCAYRQDWAHAFMSDPSAWPKSPFGERHGPTPEEMKADWSRYRGAVLQEAWEALRDAEGGPLIDGMNVVTGLTEKR